MKYIDTKNLTQQIELPLLFNNELCSWIKISLIGFVIMSLILSFPIFAHGEVNETRIPVKATENTATMFIATTTLATTTNSFTINVNVDPGEQAINAVNASLKFATSSIQITKINIDDSFCDLFIVNNFNNTTGDINIMCGKPYPGINTEAQIAQITFTKIDAGTSTIAFNPDTMVLANDGFGTNVLKETQDITF